jgi:plastocyanin
MRLVRPLALAAISTFSLAGSAVPAAAQSLLYRPPNLGGTWVPAGGVLQFNFLHRFTVSDAAANNVVTNYPTFTFALGLGKRIGLGTRFATRSLVGTGGGSNEFELLGRMGFGKKEGENGIAIAVTPAYNTAAESIDGELSLDLTRGPLTFAVAGRAMSQALGGDAAVGFAGGASLRLNDYIALDGDVGTLIDAGRDAAWSAGISFLIPGSPHTFSLHAGNSASATIQGSSFGVGVVTYGFEFTVPIHFSRFAPWFAKKERAVPVNVPFMNTAAQIDMREYRFATDSVVINVGQSVGWTNHDEVAHTVTFETSGPQSSGSIAARGTHVVTFTRPGIYRYHCEPHPMMKGVVVVK